MRIDGSAEEDAWGSSCPSERILFRWGAIRTDLAFLSRRCLSCSGHAPCGIMVLDSQGLGVLGR